MYFSLRSENPRRDFNEIVDRFETGGVPMVVHKDFGHPVARIEESGLLRIEVLTRDGSERLEVTLTVRTNDPPIDDLLTPLTSALGQRSQRLG